MKGSRLKYFVVLFSLFLFGMVKTVYSGSPPKADFNVDNAAPVVNQNIQFTDASTNGTGYYATTIVGWKWDFGSGASLSGLVNGKGPHSVSYSTPGSKTISLEITGSNNQSYIELKTNFINVGCNTIVTNITPNPASVTYGNSLNLNGNPSATVAPIVSHNWTGTGASYLNATNIQNPVFSGASAGTYSLSYTVTDSNGCTGTSSTTVTVAKKTVTITAGNQNVVFGTNSSLITRNGTFTVAGLVNGDNNSVINGLSTISYSTNYLSTTNAGSSGINITPVVSGLSASNYNFSAAPGTISISKANQFITLDLDINSTLPLNNFSVVPVYTSSSSGLPVMVTLDPGSAATLNYDAGQTPPYFLTNIGSTGFVTVNAIQSGNVNYNAATTLSQTFDVTKSNQSISFPEIDDLTFSNGLSMLLPAAASSGLTVVYSVESGPASVTGNMLSITGAGEIWIKASQPGNDIFNAATDVTQSFLVGKSEQTITINVPNEPLTSATQITATSTSGLPVTLLLGAGSAATSLINQGTYFTLTGILGNGNIYLVANQPGDSNFFPATQVIQTIDIEKTNQSILFNAIGNKTFGDSPVSLSASSSSGLPVSFSLVSGPATLSGGNILNITGAGTIVLAASQAGNSTFNPAPTVTQQVEVLKGTPVISLLNIIKNYGDSDFTVQPASTSSGSMNYTSGNTDVFTVSGNVVTLTGTGTADLVISQSPTANYFGEIKVITVTVNKANSSISVSGPSVFTYSGLPQGPETLTFAGSSGEISLNYSGTGGTIYGPDESKPSDAGTYSAIASIQADENFNSATSAPFLFTIEKANPTITVSPYSKDYDGTAHVSLGTATGVSGEALEGLDLSGTIHTNAGTYNNDSWVFTDITGNYDDATGTVNNIINTIPLIISANNLAKCFGDSFSFSGAEFEASGLVNSELIGSVTLLSTGSSSGAAAGVYPIVPSDAAGGSFNALNYSISYQNGELNVKALPTLTGAVQNAPVCPGTRAQINLTGLAPNKTFSVSYTIDGIAQPAITGLTSNAAGNSVFQTVLLTEANNAQTLQITSISQSNELPVCTAYFSQDVILDVLPQPTLTSATQANSVCEGNSAIINLTGLNPGSSFTLGFSINGIIQTPVENLIADASGNSSFTTPALNLANNGQLLEIFGIETTSDLPHCIQSLSQDVTLSVSPASVGGTASGDQSICSGSAPSAINLNAHVGDIQWQQSTNNTNFTDISGATAATLSAAQMGTISQTTYFKAKVTSGSCTPAHSNTITVTVLPDFSAGSISSAGETIGFGGNPGVIGSTADASGGDNVITYQWQSSTNAGFTAPVTIASSNTASYDPPANLTSNTWYRRQAKDNSCNTGFSTSSGVWAVTIAPDVEISAPQTIACQNETVAYSLTKTYDSYLWTITGGTPATSTSPTVNVTWGTGNRGTITAEGFVSGVSAGTNVKNVYISQLSEFTPSPDTSICTGDQANLRLKFSNKSMFFDGINDYVGISNSSLINLGTTDYRTVMLWFKANDNSTRQVLYNEGGATNGFSMYIENNSVYVLAWEGNTAWNAVSAAITTDRWYHLAFVFDQDATDGYHFKGYLDGALIGGFNEGSKADNGLNSHSAPVAIGSNSNIRFHNNSTSQNNFFNGYIDEFKLWNRSLNLTEINGEKNHWLKNPIIDAALDVYINFDNSVEDLADSPSAESGTVYGSAHYNDDAPLIPDILWTPGNAATSTLQVTPSGTTTYSYVLKEKQKTDCTQTGSITVSVHPLPTAVISGSATICEGETAQLDIHLTGSSPWTVTGIFNGSAVSNVYNSSPATIIHNSPTSATYQVTGVTDANGCSNSSASSVTVTVLPAITGNSISSAQIICSGTTPFALTGSSPLGGNGTYTYSWEQSTEGASSGFTSASGTNNLQDYAPGILNSNTWYRRKVISGLCSVTSPPIEITVNSVPLITGTTPANSCSVSPVTLQALASSGTINWYDVPSGGVSLGTGGSFTTPPLSETKSYWVDATANGCTTASRTEIIATVSLSPVTVSATSGTTAACYPTLKAAFDKINDGTHKGVIDVKINSSTTETATAVLYASGTGNSVYTAVNVFPTVSGIEISGNINGRIIDFDGADNIIIDGRVNGSGASKSLTIKNLNTGTSVSTIRFINSAENNTVRHCILASSSRATTAGGTVFFSTSAAGNGNSGNTISDCDITTADSNTDNRPMNSIYSSGTIGFENKNNTISNNNFYGFFRPAASSYGVNINSSSQNWTIRNNSFYETASFTSSGNYVYRSIYLGGATVVGFNIDGNHIGGSAPNCSGTPWTILAGGLTQFIGIDITSGTSVPTQVQNNSIKNINLSTLTVSTSVAFRGIFTAAGTVNILSNSIGSSTGNGSITVRAAASSGVTLVNAIQSASITSDTIRNNSIGSFDLDGGSANGFTFSGIITSGTAGSFTVSDNIIGSTVTPNSVKIGTSGVTTTGVCSFIGITTGNTGTVSVLTNTIQNCTTFGTGASTLQGINNTGASSSVTINENSISKFTNSGSGIIRGVSNSGAASIVRINSNVIGNHTVTSTSGTFTGITSTGAVTSSLTISNNQLGISGGNMVTYTVANGGALTGINASATAAACSVVINSNDISGISHTVPGSNTHTYISNTSVAASHDVNNNTFTNLNVSTTGNVTFINNSAAMPANATQSVKNNRVVTGFTKASAGGTVTFISSTTATANSGVSVFMEDNAFTGITVSGTTAVNGIVNTDAGAGNPAKTIRNNTLSNWTAGTGTLQGISVNNSGTGGSVTLNVIRNFTGSSTITGIITGTGNDNIFSNQINDLTSTTTAAAIVSGISVTAGTAKNIYQNTIYGLSTGAGITTGSARGIAISGGTTVNAYQNTIYSIQASALTTGTVSGIQVAGATSSNIYQNKIYGLSYTGTAITTGTVSGILVSALGASGTSTIYNNLIGNIGAASASSTTDVVRGMNISANTANSRINLYFNTVYLNAASSGTNFSATGIYHSASATATTAALEMQNNLVVNLSTPKGTGIVAAFRRSAGTAGSLNNYLLSSNYNLFYAGTPGTSRLVYYDGTAGGQAQTIDAYRQAVFTAGTVAPRDQASVSANPVFLGTSGSDGNFLHLADANCQMDGKGVPVPSVSEDFDGETRHSLTPDIGADEFTSIFAAPVIATQPVSPPAVCTGSTISPISVTTTGGVLPLTYQWYSNTVNNNTSGTIIPGANSAGFIPSAATPGTTYYYCEIYSNGAGCGTAVTNTVTVTVHTQATITLTQSETDVCYGDAAGSLSFSSPTGSPNQYSIDFDGVAEAEGFSDVSNGVLTGGSIDIAVPADGTPDSYNAMLTVINSATGCVSGSYPVTVTIHALPQIGEIN